VCRCFNPDDKERIFGIVERCPGGVQGFNTHVQSLAIAMFGKARRRSLIVPDPIGAQLERISSYV
jgi:hypothetical protein